jgi:hypothetical protein
MPVRRFAMAGGPKVLASYQIVAKMASVLYASVEIKFIFL